MANTELIILKDYKFCKGCFKDMEEGDFAVKYFHKNMKGIYCNLDCLEKSMDKYLGGSLILWGDLDKLLEGELGFSL